MDVKPADVYWAISETPGWLRLLEARAALDDDERARAERFAFAVDRDAFVAAHALLRLALSTYADKAAGDWRFAAAPSGKPELAGPHRDTSLTFSLAHARTIVACTVSRDGSVGIDVEAVPAEDIDEAFAGFSLAPAERALLERFEPAARRVAFARLWTLKEAVLKAFGEGVLPAIECELDPPRLLSAPIPGVDAAGWQLTSLMPTERHALALARVAAGAGDAVVRQVASGDP